MTARFVLAGDIGATHTRLQLAPLRPGSLAHLPPGRPAHLPAGHSADPPPGHEETRALPVVTGGGFNVHASGSGGLAAFLDTARRAFGQLPGAAVIAAAHLGISGAGAARHGEIEPLVRDELARLGEGSGIGVDPARIRVSDDLITAFTSAASDLPEQSSASPSGILLLAGSGAACVRYLEGREVSRVDGMGWLLGDVGSGIWLGRRALEAAAADLDGRGPATALTASVLGALGIDPLGERGRDSQARPQEAPVRPGAYAGERLPGPSSKSDARTQLIRAAYALSPAEWGRFGPLVSALADPVGADGASTGADSPDLVARSIAAEAVEALLHHVELVADPDQGPTTVVLAGSVLAGDGAYAPIGRLVRYALTRSGHTVVEARSPLAGALSLARAEAAAHDIP
ncbi:MAG: hypothetical protein Q4G21_00780 [Dermabacter sp.]|nr:hypothetical protein [Dermabacter sp.]